MHSRSSLCSCCVCLIHWSLFLLFRFLCFGRCCIYSYCCTAVYRSRRAPRPVQLLAVPSLFIFSRFSKIKITCSQSTRFFFFVTYSYDVLVRRTSTCTGMHTYLWQRNVVTATTAVVVGTYAPRGVHVLPVTTYSQSSPVCVCLRVHYTAAVCTSGLGIHAKAAVTQLLP